MCPVRFVTYVSGRSRAWVDFNHRPRPYQDRDLRNMFAAVIGVRGFDSHHSPQNLVLIRLIEQWRLRKKQNGTGISSGRDNKECAMFLASGPDGDFNILTESDEKFRKASNGKITCTVPHQQGGLRLLHAENFGDLDLCRAAVLEGRINLEREPRLEQLLFWIGKTKVCKDVSAASSFR
jgi:hypothetical protein